MLSDRAMAMSVSNRSPTTATSSARMPRRPSRAGHVHTRFAHDCLCCSACAGLDGRQHRSTVRDPALGRRAVGIGIGSNERGAA